MVTQGPNLGGLFGRQSGTTEGFSYSKANKEKAVHWGEDTLYDYLLNPKKYIPGASQLWPGHLFCALDISAPIESIKLPTAGLSNVLMPLEVEHGKCHPR